MLPNVVQVPVTAELTVPVTPLPLYVLLKLVAFGDRKEPKDLVSVLHCLRHCSKDDDRRYGLDHNHEPVLFEPPNGVPARPGRPPIPGHAAFGCRVGLLDEFAGPDAAVVAAAAREEAGFFVGDDRRQDVFDLFRCFHLGAGLSNVD